MNNITQQAYDEILRELGWSTPIENRRAPSEPFTTGTEILERFADRWREEYQDRWRIVRESEHEVVREYCPISDETWYRNGKVRTPTTGPIYYTGYGVESHVLEKIQRWIERDFHVEGDKIHDVTVNYVLPRDLYYILVKYAFTKRSVEITGEHLMDYPV
jgi:hypothetical protein